VSPEVEDTQAEEPSCSERGLGVVTVKKEKEQVGEGNSPDQCCTGDTGEIVTTVKGGVCVGLELVQQLLSYRASVSYLGQFHVLNILMTFRSRNKF
jgi:hypothetical protein